VNTLDGRIKVPFETKGMEQFFDGTWKFGTAKLVQKKGKYFLHIPMTKTFEDADLNQIRNVVGVDLGINFITTAYDSKGSTTFFKGRWIKDKRAHYKRVRESLQRRGTRSARRRLKAIGQRKNRWMTHVNHAVSKALVEQAGPNTLFILEDLTGVRNRTEKVHKKGRYYSVSWAYYQLRQMIEYKAKMNQSQSCLFNRTILLRLVPSVVIQRKTTGKRKDISFLVKPVVTPPMMIVLQR
jgi:IS605 OrfB family transposase